MMTDFTIIRGATRLLVLYAIEKQIFSFVEDQL